MLHLFHWSLSTATNTTYMYCKCKWSVKIRYSKKRLEPPCIKFEIEYKFNSDSACPNDTDCTTLCMRSLWKSSFALIFIIYLKEPPMENVSYSYGRGFLCVAQWCSLWKSLCVSNAYPFVTANILLSTSLCTIVRKIPGQKTCESNFELWLCIGWVYLGWKQSHN